MSSITNARNKIYKCGPVTSLAMSYGFNISKLFLQNKYVELPLQVQFNGENRSQNH